MGGGVCAPYLSDSCNAIHITSDIPGVHDGSYEKVGHSGIGISHRGQEPSPIQKGIGEWGMANFVVKDDVISGLTLGTESMSYLAFETQ